MPKLDEMIMIEVLELLTPTQKQSILVHARQLAKGNAAAPERGNERVGWDHVKRKDQASDVAFPIDDDRPNAGPKAAAHSSTVTTASDNQGLIRCEFCKAKVKPSRYANHLRKAHKTAATAAVKPVVNSKTKLKDPHARRLCGTCSAIVDANLYDEHIRETHGTTSNPVPSSNAPMAPDRNRQKSDIPKDQSPGTTAEAAPYPPGWFIDGRKRSSKGDASRQATAKGITQSARTHPTPPSKPPVKPPKIKKKNKGAKSKGKKTQQSRKSRFRPRLLQGGLCNPR